MARRALIAEGRVSRRFLGALIAVVGIGALLAVGAAPAPAATKFRWMKGYDEPETPSRLDQVGVLSVGPKQAKRILILNPGTSGASAYFRPLAKLIVRQTKGWQVWSIERRGTQLEDHSVFDRVKRGEATPAEAFDYYLGSLIDPSITDRFENIKDSEVGFAREWGMKVAVEDLKRVVSKANRKAQKVVMGGHSLGASIATAYATWDFNGKPGARKLDGLVLIDGGGGPEPRYTAVEAADQLAGLRSRSPWLAFGGIPAPLSGLFNTVGALAALNAPEQPSVLHDFPLLPPDLKAPVRPTNKGAYGYGLDAGTSPPYLAAAHVNAGRLADSGDPRGWERDGEITPLNRVAKMFGAPTMLGMDGTAWYHPTRLNLDSGAVAAGNANPAQEVLDVAATRGDELGKLPIYAFGAALGGERVVESAEALASQSSIPRRKLVLVNRERTYTHIDPLSAKPKNAFVKNLRGFLRNKVG